MHVTVYSLCVCVGVSGYVCVIWTHTCMYLCVCVCVSICIMCKSVCRYIYAGVCEKIRVQVHAYVHV